MTGAGVAAGDTEVGALRVEVRSVNGRGLAVKLRLPSACSGLEAAIDERVRAAVTRGSVLVVVERAADGAAALPDRDALRAVAAELRAIAAELQLPAPSLADVLAATGGAQREVSTSRPLPERVARLFDEALAQLVAHRARDGEGAARAITAGLDGLAQMADAVSARAPQLVADYRTRLLQRVQEFVAEHVPEPPPAVDLVREVAVYADKVDVAEELQRLRAHIGEARALLAAGGEVGRRLEFLLQELLRETNTLGSKSPDTEVAHTVVAMKAAIGTIREQVANLE